MINFDAPDASDFIEHNFSTPDFDVNVACDALIELASIYVRGDVTKIGILLAVARDKHILKCFHLKRQERGEA